ncbi:MAG: FecR domain-containing protein [Phycisphaerae bacterium]|nr:FecR domain-containing protein [Gemmatimonadaceae bacterium]
MAERIGPRRNATAAKVAGVDDRKKTPWVALGIAGVVVVAIVAFLLNDPNKGERDFGKALSSEESRKVPTARGQRGQTKLPDSSTVRLAPETMLTIPPKGHRGAGIEGAAHFVVAPDSVSFRVRSRKVGVETKTGTLAVTSYPEDKEVFVKALEGALTVHPNVDAKETVELAVGPGMAINEAGVTRMLTQPESDAAFAWVDGSYSLNAVPLVGTIPILQRWYNTPVSLADKSLDARPVTAMLKLDSSKDALDAIQAAASVHITFKGDTLTLADGAPPAVPVVKKKGK